jgi:threonine synthase
VIARRRQAGYRAWFESLHDPSERYPLDEVVYTARDGGLFQVVHDLDELRKTSAVAWKEIFEERAHNEWPYGSGVWGKKEWVLPGPRQRARRLDVRGPHEPVLGGPLRQASSGVEDLWIKLCGNSHTGSFKDLGMTVLVSHGEADDRERGAGPGGGLRLHRRHVGRARGLRAAAGIPAVVFLPRGKISLAQLIQPVANGAIVLALDTDFDGCMEIVRQVTERDGIYLANSMNSLRIEGQKTVGIEIVQQFDWEVPDWIVIPGGNLGNVSALAQGPRSDDRARARRGARGSAWPRRRRANPLYLSYRRGFEVFEPIAARPTLASAIQIGNPVSYEKAIDALRRYDGVVEQASEQELAEACAAADRTGLFNCPHTGVALAAMRSWSTRNLIRPGERVVVDLHRQRPQVRGLQGRLPPHELEGIVPAGANPPIELPARYPDVRDRMLREIELRFTRRWTSRRSTATRCTTSASTVSTPRPCASWRCPSSSSRPSGPRSAARSA